MLIIVIIIAWPAKILAKSLTASENGRASWLIISTGTINIRIGAGIPEGTSDAKYFFGPCFITPAAWHIKKINTANVAVKLIFAVGGTTPGIRPKKFEKNIKENTAQKKGSQALSCTSGSRYSHNNKIYISAKLCILPGIIFARKDAIAKNTITSNVAANKTIVWFVREISIPPIFSGIINFDLRCSNIFISIYNKIALNTVQNPATAPKKTPATMHQGVVFKTWSALYPINVNKKTDTASSRPIDVPDFSNFFLSTFIFDYTLEWEKSIDCGI